MSSNVQVTVRMSPELRDRLDAAADERVVSRSLVARIAIESYLDELEDDPIRRLRQSAATSKPSIWRRLFPFSSAMVEAWRGR